MDPGRRAQVIQLLEHAGLPLDDDEIALRLTVSRHYSAVNRMRVCLPHRPDGPTFPSTIVEETM